jgi:hypothetical protein
MDDYSTRHLRFGWRALLVFAALGLVLESLQGFKAGMYVDVSNETRRLMWTLAHAHGIGLAIVNVLFGLTLRLPELRLQNLRFVSSSLIAASVLLPAGFFLGGVAFYSGDPGIGVVAVPAGAVLLLAALLSIARATTTPAGPRPGRDRTAPAAPKGGRP